MAGGGVASHRVPSRDEGTRNEVGVDHLVTRAVFLDRDGVLNHLVFNPSTGEYESPHVPEDLCVIDGVVPSLRRLTNAGFELFLVSNQPSYAKGKTSLEHIEAIHRRLDGVLTDNDVVFREYFYCLHHPDGIEPDFSGPCRCRKPAPFFLLEAARKHGVDLFASWMVGDQATDVVCGQTAGCRTVLVMNEHSIAKREPSRPDVRVGSLSEAADRIIGGRDDRGKNG
ncbi:D-glycero-alpha-D-manno-heptose-1,7-bisphosphate 7-phosphatase [Mycolicibacterium sp. P1-18]|uniref:D-glycero-alpha-D-manno-heptose-1,7-bisphosphate 7-phosphatase n=1 Tax=Mycolicibacterium sp. P1-18 TaxID=2024615 RepID=UPI003519F255